MQVSIVQLAYGDDEGIEARIDRAAGIVESQRGSSLIILPELWPNGGFTYRDWESTAQPTDGTIAQRFSALARELGATIHAGSIVERPADGSRGPEGKDLWNTSLVFGPDGALVATYRKIHRFGFGTGEPKLMEAGGELATVSVNDLVLGLTTCYDLRFPELYRAYVDLGATAFAVPAAWPAARVEPWRLLLRARAIEDQSWVLACNTAGTHAGTPMGGRSAIIAPTGDVVAEAGTDEEVLVADIDASAVSSIRESFPVLADRRL